MGERFLFLLGSAIVATTLALLATYSEYKVLAETVTLLIGTTGAILSLIDYIRRH
jgi:hypothetical protein